MRNYSLTDIKAIQRNPERIRNICILAHVDHGKTTLADHLVETSGIISKRLAGKMRYMDSRPDEQQRGITMKSSCISLGFKHCDEDFIINLIDSPGHVDFSGEVASALRLCDGALILVDVVEGVGSQTKMALREAYIERIKPILVLNKIDRLIAERKCSTLDAYIILQQILEQINAYIGELFTTDILEQTAKQTNEKLPEVNKERMSLSNKDTDDWKSGLDDADDSDLYFSPIQGNVVFASAIDGWGFRISDFSKFLSNKLGLSETALNRTLWGDYYLNSKQKRIMKGAQSKAKKPLFVTIILENIWSVYESILERNDKVMLEKIISSLNVTIPNYDLNHSDPRIRLKALFNQWLPLSTTLLKAICFQLPSPCHLDEERVKNLMCVNSRRFESLPSKTQKLKNDFMKCDPSDAAPKIVCISKMFAVEKSDLPQNKFKPLTLEEISERRQRARMRSNETNTNGEISEDASINTPESEENDKNVFIAFARVFSGSLKKGDVVYVLGPKHDPSKITDATVIQPNLKLIDLPKDQHVTQVKIENLYLLMGRELECLDEVPAGNIAGIGGLEDHVLKTATLSDHLECPPFIDLHILSKPILAVALEPQNPNDIHKLTEGLSLLNQADPCVEVRLESTGEHVIVTTGEVHLQKCIDDLVQRLACIEINVSPPIVPFRETIVFPPKLDMVNEEINDQNAVTQADISDVHHKTIEILTPNKKSSMKIKAIPLPVDVTDLLEKSQDLLRTLRRLRHSATGESPNEVANELKHETIEKMNELRQQLIKLFAESNYHWPLDIVDRIWTFGPKHCGPNILVNCIPNCQRSNVWKMHDNKVHTFDYDNSFVTGFQLATLAGPLCEEPLMGVCFIVEDWVINEELSTSTADPYGPISGQIISTSKEGCRKAFQAQPQRLMAAMFSCNIQVTTEALGKMYAVMGRRHGRILHSDVEEGSQRFNVEGLIPVVESFEFSNEIRKQTSGLANPQLVFSHYEVIDIDPYWVPSTDEEYALFGCKADTENRARLYMNSVRRRKGLHVDEQIVQFAEKQRTLTKNK